MPGIVAVAIQCASSASIPPSGLLLYSIDIIDKISTDKRIEDRRTANAVHLSQIPIIANAPDDLSLAQHMAVMRLILQTVDIRFKEPLI